MSDCLMFTLQNKTLTYNNPMAWRFDYWRKFFDLIILIESLGTNIKTILKMYKIIGLIFTLLSFAITYCFIVTSLNIKKHLNLINRRGVKVEILGVDINLCLKLMLYDCCSMSTFFAAFLLQYEKPHLIQFKDVMFT